MEFKGDVWAALAEEVEATFSDADEFTLTNYGFRVWCGTDIKLLTADASLCA